MISSINSNQEYYRVKPASHSVSNNGQNAMSIGSEGSSEEERIQMSRKECSMEEIMEMMQGESQARNQISSIDEDSDGTISSDEYEDMISQMGIPNALSAEEFFTQYDTDGDGEITQEEMPEPGSVGASQTGTTQAMQQSYEVDTTSSEEELADLSDIFTQYDSDGDGTLSVEEFEKLMEDAKKNGEEKNSEDENMSNLAARSLEAYEKNYEFAFAEPENVYFL